MFAAVVVVVVYIWLLWASCLELAVGGGLVLRLLLFVCGVEMVFWWELLRLLIVFDGVLGWFCWIRGTCNMCGVLYVLLCLLYVVVVCTWVWALRCFVARVFGVVLCLVLLFVVGLYVCFGFGLWCDCA